MTDTHRPATGPKTGILAAVLAVTSLVPALAFRAAGRSPVLG